jgi:hypothetical protein
VKTPLSNTSNGVSSSGGRVRCKIIGPFCGNAVVIARSSGPPGKGKVTIVCAQAGTESAEMPTTLAWPSNCRRVSALRVRLIVSPWVVLSAARDAAMGNANRVEPPQKQ